MTKPMEVPEELSAELQKKKSRKTTEGVARGSSMILLVEVLEKSPVQLLWEIAVELLQQFSMKLIEKILVETFKEILCNTPRRALDGTLKLLMKSLWNS